MRSPLTWDLKTLLYLPIAQQAIMIGNTMLQSKESWVRHTINWTPKSNVRKLNAHCVDISGCGTWSQFISHK